MRRIVTFMVILMATIVYGKDGAQELYDYPYKDKYDATIIGALGSTPTISTKRVPIKEYEIKLKDKKDIPENLWYQEGYRFSAALQKNYAPLIFVIAGTGSTHNSAKMKLMQKAFYDYGFSVINISSPFNSNFMVNASSTHTPGILADDCEDLYKVMKLAYDKIKNKAKVSDIYLTGYSLGGTETAFLMAIDEREGYFQFKRGLMINPSVDLVSSAYVLDSFLGYGDEAGAKIAKMLAFAEQMATKAQHDEYRKKGASNDAIFALFDNKKLSDMEKKALIGLAFRMTSIEAVYAGDVLNRLRAYIKQPNRKYESMFTYYKALNFACFEDYLKKILVPVMASKKGMTYEDVRNATTLRSISKYLKNSEKLAVVTNIDDFILNEKDIDFLKDTFGDRLVLYPYGGHCGNMLYDDNIKEMAKYLYTGKFSDKAREITVATNKMPRKVEEKTDTLPANVTADMIYPGYDIDDFAMKDPLEKFNRRMYYFNYGFDKYLFIPVTKAYVAITPKVVQKGLGNFFDNNRNIKVTASSLAQGKIKKAMRAIGRFSMNAIAGGGGLIDTASAMGMPRPYEDFGMVLAHYGVPSGPYVVLPIMGPKNIRDSFGIGLDWATSRFALNPYYYIPEYEDARWYIAGVNGVDLRRRIPFTYYSSNSPFEYEYMRLVMTKYRKTRIEAAKNDKEYKIKKQQ